MNTTTKPIPGPGGNAPHKPDYNRRSPTEVSAPAPQTPRRLQSGESAVDARKLFIGKDVALSGEIGSCEMVLVEGNVEAKLRETRHIEITEGGSFKGCAEVDDADIAGRFEGDLIVHGRLKVRATGQVEGNIHYGALEVESGGRMIGEIHASATPAGAKAGATVDPARLAGFPSLPPASAAVRGAGPDGN
ncbi:MAG: polymer-forming cytoskeletal protein [Rhodospirillaceae bacterium]